MNEMTENFVTGLTIYVVSGSGFGKTELSAFDAALKATGVCNYNLIPLSSIIPPDSKVVKMPILNLNENEYGHKLYCVKAEIRSIQPKEIIAAGIGWYQYQDNRGLFVEHDERGTNLEEVIRNLELKISNSLNDLCDFRNIPFDKNNVHSKIAHTQVNQYPSCALALAVYQSEGWT